jgi:hypothetical protein
VGVGLGAGCEVGLGLAPGVGFDVGVWPGVGLTAADGVAEGSATGVVITVPGATTCSVWWARHVESQQISTV